jgi:DNA mismatch endonuclease (patch repair protein)
MEFWNQKLDRNIARDVEVRERLNELGWRVLTIWECETKQLDVLAALVGRIRRS